MAANKAMVVALAIALIWACSAESFACSSVLPNYNISSSTIAPPKFVVSALDCCNACAAFGPKCVASVFSNYYCFFKGSVEANELVPVAGPTALIQASLTTTIATTTTTTTTTTTSAPPTTTRAPPTTTSAAPATTTSAPAVLGPKVVIRTVSCDYSSDCSRREDSSCYDHAYINGSCVSGPLRYSCIGEDIVIDTFSSVASCNKGDAPTSHEVEAANVCYMTDNELYVGQYCDVYSEAPVGGMKLTRTACPNGCDDGGQCTKNEFVTGVCTNSNPFYSMQGSSLIAWCYPDRVLFVGYQDANCEGDIVDGRSEPAGTQCFLDQNEIHYQNLCRKS